MSRLPCQCQVCCNRFDLPGKQLDSNKCLNHKITSPKLRNTQYIPEPIGDKYRSVPSDFFGGPKFKTIIEESPEKITKDAVIVATKVGEIIYFGMMTKGPEKARKACEIRPFEGIFPSGTVFTVKDHSYYIHVRWFHTKKVKVIVHDLMYFGLPQRLSNSAIGSGAPSDVFPLDDVLIPFDWQNISTGMNRDNYMTIEIVPNKSVKGSSSSSSSSRGGNNMDIDGNTGDNPEWVKIKFCKYLYSKHAESAVNVQDCDLYGRVFSTVGEQTQNQMIADL